MDNLPNQSITLKYAYLKAQSEMLYKSSEAHPAPSYQLFVCFTLFEEIILALSCEPSHFFLFIQNELPL